MHCVASFCKMLTHLHALPLGSLAKLGRTAVSPLQAEANALQCAASVRPSASRYLHFVRGVAAPTSRTCMRNVHTSSRVAAKASTSPSESEPAMPENMSHLDEERFRMRKEQPPGVTRLIDQYAEIPVERVRNFSVIAHIDHGKSTLSDKILELTGNIWPTRKGEQQVLDHLKVERERGITVKAQSASMVYVDPKDGTEYLLNLIDTPGHVDFSYEVSRSLAACQGALLLVDAAQGVQAQTVANHNAAKDAGLRLIPVLTKIDLPTADPEPALAALEAAFGFAQDDSVWTSAKSGSGIPELFPAIINRLPAPGTNDSRSKPLRCLLFDSWYDEYRGVVCAVQVVEGCLKPGDAIVAAHSGDRFAVQEVGLMAPSRVPVPKLSAGNIGYMIANMKNVRQARVGDTFFHLDRPAEALPGFRPAKPMVFASLYPVDSGDFNALQTAVERLTLNDASVTVEKESSSSLGFGLRCGFLGLLHMDVFNQRLQDEFQTPVIISSPQVAYRITLRAPGNGQVPGKEIIVERPADFPEPQSVQEYYEPTAHVSIMAPAEFTSTLMGLLTERRGVQEDVIYLNHTGGSSSASSTAALLAALPSKGSASAPAASEDVSGGSTNLDDAAAALATGDGASNDDVEDDDQDDDDDADEEESEEADALPTFSPAARSRSSSSSPAPAASITASSERVVLKYRLPWAEVVSHLYDQIKSLTAGYASLDWLPGDYQRADIVKVDVMVNQKPVDALSFVAHKDKALFEARRVALKLKSVISRQQFEISIQAAIGGKIIAKERIAPYRKDVLIKSGKTVGGGDKSRKQKLLQKQKEGKKRMKTVGNVQLSQEAFHSIMASKA